MKTLNKEFDGKLSLAISIFEGRYHKAFLYQLIRGQLDLDRMDYLKRDSFFSGVAEATIGHDRIITMLDVVDGKIVVEQKGRYSVEQFLMARRLMYWQVYLHKAGLAAERMLRRVMELLRQRYVEGHEYPGVPQRLASFMRTLDNPVLADDPTPILDDFAKLDDVDVVYTLKVLAEGDDFLLSFLSKSILDRQLFHTQFMDTKPSAGYISTLAGSVAEHYKVTEDQAVHLVIQGFESIPTYKTSKEEIMILMKNGDVVPMSHIMELRNDSVADTWFLCYPKAIRSNTF
jgi:HD superfamily phosphohydrolase